MTDEIKTVAMKRDPEQFPAPHAADVHPDEVANYAAAGFVPADETAEEPAAKRGRPRKAEV